MEMCSLLVGLGQLFGATHTTAWGALMYAVAVVGSDKYNAIGEEEAIGRHIVEKALDLYDK